ncbi:replication protein [Cytobacillus depressus]|uniref:Replication protein n=1 Tax=Cytobacillus depressus TaxID=1602942 RepID=A0A6L3V3A0_9BACI|nr:poly-gamma-glutamate hydrolase family protein [Cytobacillus depressus]KAB2328928.1 replication protein [Cytobacillus depressus]
MADLYRNFNELSKAYKMRIQFDLRMKKGSSGVIYFTPHGGGIEAGCSELSEFSADADDSYYIFDAKLSAGNADMHVTSTNYDEPNGRRLVAQNDIAVAYHGYSDTKVKNTKIGGRDIELQNLIGEEFTAVGIPWEIEPAGSGIAGAEANNIVNITTRGAGVQLEISTLQRTSFFTTNTAAGRRNTRLPEFDNYIDAVKRAVARYKATL